MRRLSTAITAAILLTLTLPTGASAETRIIELDFVFTPNPSVVLLGNTVTWKNQVFNQHTTTDQSALALWDSGLMTYNDSFSYTVTAAGTYPYFCTLHERFGMFGTLQVRDVAQPPSGVQGTLFTITVASQVAPAGFVYDIQKRDPGAGWQNWRVGVTDPAATFDSAGQPLGSYAFRSRMRRTSDNKAIPLSPPVTVSVTA